MESNFSDFTGLRLNLFDGGDGGTSGGAVGDAAAPTQTAEAAQTEATQTKVVGQEEGKKPTAEERQERYRAAMQEYRDLADADAAQVRKQHEAQVQSLEQQLRQFQPVIDLLTQRYQTDGDLSKLRAAVEDDEIYWERAAEKAGMSVEQFRQWAQIKQQNAALLQKEKERQGREAAQRHLKQWSSEAAKTKESYPSFNLEAESKNPAFVAMLRAGVPVQHAYEVLHMDDIKAQAARSAASAKEKQVVDDIRAKGNRPSENGTGTGSGFTVGKDVRSMTRKERDEIAQRAMRGERIIL